jgi:hypothetical protein
MGVAKGIVRGAGVVPFRGESGCVVCCGWGFYTLWLEKLMVRRVGRWEIALIVWSSPRPTRRKPEESMQAWLRSASASYGFLRWGFELSGKLEAIRLVRVSKSF